MNKKSEIVKKVGCDDQLNIATDSDEDEEIEEISKPTINPKEALDKINDLRIFFLKTIAIILSLNQKIDLLIEAIEIMKKKS
ncbi:hypothetical protein BpHYR1_011932 [Brachionus plicatilis]|uniref:Uncharacterized protein n=1 Tax=Brachionus plicatilis TaxID=10195 RepID=A0A3M7SMT6_BRAPC|nr:hypothetical protein BpHYR1_011932 [Brachionus plicatilis]